jgi:uncharacterized repeat protein (TIGR02543 family)
MENITYHKVRLLSVVLVASLVFLSVAPFSVHASSPSLVQISPASKIVSAGQSFSLNVMCTPGQSIKAFELKVSFNPTYLQATSVSEGTIFNGHTTFFNDGTIDNNAGTIVDIYGLILGDGEVSTAGSFVSLSFNARLASGTSSVCLYDVGVTNQSSYVPITITNGSVTLREFTLSVTLDGSGSVTKSPNQGTYAYGTVVQLTASASTGWTFSSWSGNASGSSNPVSITMTGNKSVVAHFTQNQYTLTVAIDGSGTVSKNPNSASYTYGTVVTLTASASSGWVFGSWTGDLSGSQNPKTITMTGNKAVTAHFSDNAPPVISGIAHISSVPLDTDASFGWVNISCTVTDNVAVSQVLLRIHTPSGSWNNVSMTSRPSGVYYYRSTTAFSSAGNYSYSLRAQDTGGNANTSSQLVLAMPSNWDINSDGTCTILDLVLLSNCYGSTGSNGWIREDADNNGEISILDFVVVSNHYGETWWT